MDYFHLSYPSADDFIGTLQNRLRQSTSSVLRERFGRWDPEIHGERALAFVTKVEMLNHVVTRLNADVAKLVDYLKSVPEAVEQCVVERCALVVPDHDLLWYLSLDVESFLFEARSAYELFGKFLKAFFQLIFQRAITELDIVEAVRLLGSDVSWIPLLKQSRNLFAHSAASWLSVERTQANPPQFDLLLLKGNYDILADDDFVHFRDCRGIQRGLTASMKTVVLWIVNEIGAVEHEEGPEH